MASQSKNDGLQRTPRPGKFVWFEHVSRDAKRAQAFFGEVLGWKTLPWGDTSYDMIATGDDMDSMIGGYDALGSGRERPHWISYLSVDDVDATTRAAAANGGTVIEEPHDLPGVGRAARIADPLGAELFLFRNDAGDPADPPATEAPPPGRFFWNELHTTDAAKALPFYENVFGFTHQTMKGPGGPYHILSKDGIGRAGVTDHAPGDAPHWLPYVAVEDPDGTISRARNRGATILAGPMDIPGVGRFGVLEDPTGAVLAVMKAIPPQAS